MVYNTKHSCTYNSPDIILETDNITDTDTDFVKNALYRNDLLYIFDLDEFNEKNIIIQIQELYEKLKNHPEILLCIQKLAFNNMNITNNVIDLEFGFILLFSYELLYIIHPCICDFLETGKISILNIQKIKNIYI